MQDISWLAEELLASQEELYSMEVVSCLVYYVKGMQCRFDDSSEVCKNVQ
jgi:hypothetical protein